MVVAPARFAIARCASGGIILSSVATRYQLGFDFQAGSYTAPPSARQPEQHCFDRYSERPQFGQRSARPATHATVKFLMKTSKQIPEGRCSPVSERGVATRGREIGSTNSHCALQRPWSLPPVLLAGELSGEPRGRLALPAILTVADTHALHKLSR
jgi:hypothetical protein